MGARKEERKIIILKSMDEFGLKLSLSSFIDFRVFKSNQTLFFMFGTPSVSIYKKSFTF
jgi:hypothetical protein